MSLGSLGYSALSDHLMENPTDRYASFSNDITTMEIHTYLDYIDCCKDCPKKSAIVTPLINMRDEGIFQIDKIKRYVGQYGAGEITFDDVFKI